jgi:hypothetical protein
MNFTRKRYILVLVIVSVVMLVIGWFGYNQYKNKESIVPKSISSQLSNPLLVPDNKSSIINNSFLYDRAESLVTFKVKLNDGQVAIFADQPLPSVINDLPKYVTDLTSSLGCYSNFDSLMGTVYLCNPKGFTQVVILNTDGITLFITAKKVESQNFWTQVINNLRVVN